MVESYERKAGITKSTHFQRTLLIVKSLIKPLVATSLLWNVYLVLGVILNQSYALTRAAGGQFETFPVGIRVAYILTLAILTYQALLLFTAVKRPAWIYKALFYLGIASTFVNAISRSSNERWNAIPAALIALGFYREWRNSKN